MEISQKYIQALDAAGEEVHYWYDVPLSDPVAEQIRQEILAGGHNHIYRLSDAQGYTYIAASSIEEAESRADEWVRDCYEPAEKTYWVNVTVTDMVTAERRHIKVEVEPPEPPCIHPRTGERWPEHDWRREYRVVGGIRENPGVWGNGGGVTITCACHRCGCGRTVDTWAQDPEDGQQGLRAVIYRPGAYIAEIEREGV